MRRRKRRVDGGRPVKVRHALGENNTQPGSWLLLGFHSGNSQKIANREGASWESHENYSCGTRCRTGRYLYIVWIHCRIRWLYSACGSCRGHEPPRPRRLHLPVFPILYRQHHPSDSLLLWYIRACRATYDWMAMCSVLAVHMVAVCRSIMAVDRMAPW